MTKICTTAILHCDRPGCAQFSENMTADVQYAIDKRESLGLGKQLILHGNLSTTAQDFFTAYGRPSTSFSAEYALQCCMILKRTLGGNFDIFAVSGESTALSAPLDNPFKTNWREGLYLFNFFSTAFDPRAWTMVVFWKENLGREPQLITPENEGGDETSCPSPTKFFDDPDVPTKWTSRTSKTSWTARTAWPTTRMASSSIICCDRERVGHESASRERLPPRPSPPEPQLIPIPLKNNNNNHPPLNKNGDGLDRVSEFTVMRKFHWNHKLNLWLLQKLRTFQKWIPHHQQLDHHHQLNREVAQEETRDLDRKSEYLHFHLRRT